MEKIINIIQNCSIRMIETLSRNLKKKVPGNDQKNF